MPRSTTSPQKSQPSGQLSNTLLARHRAEELASALPPLLVAAERVAATVAQGVHGRRRVGLGETFWQFRRYQPGDAPSMIDWRQSAKTQPVYVRENEWEAAQSVWLWRDRSASMDFRSAAGLPTKRERADLLTLATAVLLARGGERVALLNSGVRPDHGKTAIDRIARLMTDPRAAAAPDPLPRVEPLPRHAQTVLFGDLLSPLSEIHATVAGLTGRGLRGHLVQILDPAEETLPYDGRVDFHGMEGEQNLLVPRVEAVREAYRERLKGQQDGLAALARTAGWSFAVHRTDRSPQSALLTLWGAMAMEAV
ncbi:DUF58 domain-containing protein [Azospirillum sp. TSH100]|uniref:DUF58 domain-containing protein n=1 Tax=Azospirillum sp. TSH100 TaxID=652764 RepID=UPI000D68A4FC|nr:DUF58 domain-containing protein [Azospirillum sp. TSH100]QCG88119.1 DUF58 domain-containing protein [Azospirillum sp. TSH100]